MKRSKDIFRKEAVLFTSFEGSDVQCGTCWHQCIIKEGNYGLCRTRINIDGTLYCVNYGLFSSYSVNPIEKKPLFHYFPGSFAATVGSYSCNFLCPWCHNYSISKILPSDLSIFHFLAPEELVQMVEMDPQIRGISFSFNEPILSFEYILDVFQQCKSDTYQMLVTNGYMTTRALMILIKAGLTGMSVTIKGDSKSVKRYCKADVDRVWDNIRMAIDENVHVEVVCLIIPTINDSPIFFRETARKLSSIDQNTPLHFTRFFPAYQFTDIEPTSIQTLENAHQIASEEGLNFVYLGNVFGHRLENTYCPECKYQLIKRTGYQLEINLDLDNAFCPACHSPVPIYISK